MSASPQKEVDVEPGAQSPDETEHMERDLQESQAQALGYEFEVKEQDRWLPIANVARIMKTALPENAKIAKEAKECMQECVSEFISFITSEAVSFSSYSFREVSAGETKNGQWRRHPVCNDIARVRELCGGAQDLPFEISRSKCFRLLSTTPMFIPLLSPILGKDEYLNNEIDWWFETQSARGENQNRPGSGYGSGGPVGGGSSGPNASSSSAAYHGQSESTNSIMSPHGIEAPEHDNGAYGSVYPAVVGSSHNGGGGESY
ncbi:MAG: hypothetical protein M1836_004026 [Candelina mexicana]|nr:MAG: hypothetical protein M1836_004026 [Candelina mexicana]